MPRDMGPLPLLPSWRERLLVQPPSPSSLGWEGVVPADQKSLFDLKTFAVLPQKLDGFMHAAGFHKDERIL